MQPRVGALVEVCGDMGVALYAAMASDRDDRAAIYAAGFKDYLRAPYLLREAEVRIPRIVSATKVRSRSISSEQILVDRTCEFLLSDIAQHVTLDDLARQMGTNRTTMSRAFSLVHDKGALAWFREQKMAVAAELLGATDLSIQQISFEVGYEDSNNFSTSFKNLFGLSPREYRKQLRESKI